MKHVVPFVEYILENETTDRKYREQAAHAFELLKNYCDEDNKHNLVPMRRDGGFGVHSWELGFGSEGDQYGQFWILLTSKEKVKSDTMNIKGGYGHTTKNIPVILLPVLIHPNDLTYLETRITGMKQTFIHEFVHLMDELRSGGLRMQSGKLARAGDHVGYMNTPQEYNAHYQDIMSSIDNWIDSPNLRDVAHRIIPNNFEGFLKEVKTRFGGDYFISLMTPETYKRFVKRLYDYFQKRIVGDLYKQK